MHRRSGGVVVSAFLPDAERATVVPREGRGEILPLSKIHPDGLFAARLEHAADSFSYRILVQTGGSEFELEDPYRFPPLLGEQDVYLLAEGTHSMAYKKLGAHPS